MINGLLRKENIRIVESVSSWQEAVSISLKPLIENGCITEGYLEEIMHNTNKYGAYYVLAPDIALPHASASDSVLKTQIGLLIVKKPVKFSADGFDVRLIFPLATRDTESHLEALKELSLLLSQGAVVNSLVEASSVEDVEQILS